MKTRPIKNYTALGLFGLLVCGLGVMFTGFDLSGSGHHGHRLVGIRAQIADPADADAGHDPREGGRGLGVAPDLFRVRHVRIADTCGWAE